jgi:hypothetical protein
VVILAHEPDPVFSIHWHQRHRTHVFDDIQPGRFPVRQADLLTAHIEGAPLIYCFGMKDFVNYRSPVTCGPFSQRSPKSQKISKNDENERVRPLSSFQLARLNRELGSLSPDDLCRRSAPRLDARHRFKG